MRDCASVRPAPRKNDEGSRAGMPLVVVARVVVSSCIIPSKPSKGLFRLSELSPKGSVWKFDPAGWFVSKCAMISRSTAKNSSEGGGIGKSLYVDCQAASHRFQD